jgi:DNA-binding transcriptional regulator YiaG
MKSLQERAERITHTVEVPIPNLDGTGIAYRVPIDVPALRDPIDGEIYLESDAQEIIDRTKARHMGLMSAESIRGLREYLCVTQKGMSELLQIGAKTYTRWESGNDRPSRSLNILLRALHDGRIDVPYLRSLRPILEAPATTWGHVLISSTSGLSSGQVNIESAPTNQGTNEQQPLAA